MSLNKSKSIFKKSYSWFSIDFLVRSIKTDGGSFKFLIAILIDWKIALINPNSGKNTFLKNTANFVQKLLKVLNFMNKIHEYEMKCFFKNTSFKFSFPKIKIFKHSPFKFSSTKYVLHKTQGIFKLGWSNQKHTQLHVQCLAKSNLCSVCN